jgi:Tfp pilus assembly protein PilV
VGLQTSSLKQNQSAMTRTVAVEYANAIMDKMRSNPEDAARGYYNIRADGTYVVDAIPASDNKADRAKEEIKLWHKNLMKALPGNVAQDQVKVQVCNVNSDAAGSTGKCGTEGDYAMVCIRWDQAGGNASDPLFESGTQQFFLVGRI